MNSRGLKEVKEEEKIMLKSVLKCIESIRIKKWVNKLKNSECQLGGREGGRGGGGGPGQVG